MKLHTLKIIDQYQYLWSAISKIVEKTNFNRLTLIIWKNAIYFAKTSRLLQLWKTNFYLEEECIDKKGKVSEEFMDFMKALTVYISSITY